ncbi:MAG: hypothetical protein AB1416_10025 [Actinomycetota bacterium]
MTGVVRRLELLFFDGCPGHEAPLPRLGEVIRAAGVKAEVVQRPRRVPGGGGAGPLPGVPDRAASTAATSTRGRRGAPTSA